MALPAGVPKPSPFLAVKEIADIYLRKNFQALTDYFQNENQLLGFKFFEVTFSAAEENRTVAHGLGYLPQDIVLSKITGTGKVSFNRSLFTKTNLNITSSGAATIRFYCGSHWLHRTVSGDAEGAVQDFQALITDSSVSLSNVLVLFPLTTAQIQSGEFPNATPSTYQVRDIDNSIYMDCTSSAKSCLLPTAKGKIGQRHLIKKTDAVDANLLTITFFGAETANARTSIVLSFLNQSVEFESDDTNWRIINFFAANEILTNQTSTPKTFTASDRYPTLQGNSLPITPGAWKLWGEVFFTNTGLTPGYASCNVLWGSANGADTNVAPAALSALTQLTQKNSALNFTGAGVTASNNAVAASELIIVVTASATVYLDAYGTMTTAARTQVYAYANAERIGP